MIAWDSFPDSLLVDQTNTFYLNFAFSPDLRTAANKTEDGSLRIWDLATGKESALLKALGGWEAVAYSADSKTLAAGENAGTVRLYDLTGPMPKATERIVAKAPNTMGSLEFSPDGKLLAGADTGGNVFIWDLATLERLHEWKLPQHVARPMRFANNSRHLALNAGNGTIYILRLGAQPTPPPAKSTFPPLDPAWVKKVQGLPADKQADEVGAELKRRNPGFDGKVTPTIEANQVTGLELLADAVTDLTPVRALPELKTIHCMGSAEGKGRLADLSPLRGLKLFDVWVDWTLVEDLSPLRGMQLRTVYLGWTRVKNLEPLRGMPLTTVWLSSAPVSNLSPLQGMKLTNLSIANTHVVDLADLAGMPLATLSCQGLPIKDLSPLKASKLEILHMSNALVTDLSPLKGQPLASLMLENSAVTDLSGLEGLPITSLTLQGSPVSDLTPIQKLPLVYLNLINCPVRDLKPLAGMKALATLWLSGTKVSDLTPLRQLPLKYINLKNTEVTDLSPLAQVPLESIDLEFKPERDAKVLRSIKTLKTINLEPAAEFWKKVDAAKKP